MLGRDFKWEDHQRKIIRFWSPCLIRIILQGTDVKPDEMLGRDFILQTVYNMKYLLSE